MPFCLTALQPAAGRRSAKRRFLVAAGPVKSPRMFDAQPIGQGPTIRPATLLTSKARRPLRAAATGRAGTAGASGGTAMAPSNGGAAHTALRPARSQERHWLFAAGVIARRAGRLGPGVARRQRTGTASGTALRPALRKSAYIRRYIGRQKDKRVSGYSPANPRQSLVPVNGIELLTFALRMRCSTN